MKVLSVGLLSLVTAVASAKSLTTYADIETAASSGHSLRLAIDMSKCVHQPQMPAVIGVVKADNFVISRDKSAKITTAIDHFTLAHPQHKGEPVLEHVKYTLDDMGLATITIANIDPRNYNTYSNVEMKCNLNDGFYVYQNAED